jgi:hypothetical protein
MASIPMQRLTEHLFLHGLFKDVFAMFELSLNPTAPGGVHA